MIKFFDNEEFAAKIAELAKTADQKALVVWSTDCAERVLKNYERYYGNNNAKMAILAGRKWLSREVSIIEARKAAFAAHSAARIAAYPEACFAARSAGQAVSTVHVSSHALHAATYAAKSVFFASPNEFAAENVAEERRWQYAHLTELLKRSDE
ncbi:MAG: hypothetical protein PHC84_06720 [Clostridia bacterium]|nr:hypothetical protein [Clostridia bacterium]